MEEVFSALVKDHGLGVAVLVVACYSLWKVSNMLWNALKNSFTDRITALESAVTDCQEKHDRCEEGKRHLTLALIDVLDGRDDTARQKCQDILKGEKP